MLKKQDFKQNNLKTLISRSKFFWTIIKSRLFKKLVPVISVIVVNSKCNFTCKYCFGNYHSKISKDYTLEEMKHLIDELFEMGTRYLNIHGGETLLRNDIGEIVDYIKGKGIYCCLITNGSLLKHKINEVRNVDNITISLDGRKENNDMNRGSGAFNAAYEAIQIAKQYKLPLRISATLTKATMNDIEYMSEMARKYNFALYYSILFKPLPDAKELQMTDREIREALLKIKECKRQGYPIFTSNSVLDYAIRWPFDHNEKHYIWKSEHEGLNKIPKNEYINCHYGQSKFIFESDGYVYPCFLIMGTGKFEPLNWKVVGVRKAIEHVRKTNLCVACPALSQNDWNLLLGLKNIPYIIQKQLLEVIKRN